VVAAGEAADQDGGVGVGGLDRRVGSLQQAGSAGGAVGSALPLAQGGAKATVKIGFTPCARSAATLAASASSNLVLYCPGAGSASFQLMKLRDQRAPLWSTKALTGEPAS
jgi:hypothetical protein